MKCQRQILHKHWSQHATNAEISARTGLPPVTDFIRRRRLSLFGHIARLTQGTPAHNALHCQVGLASSRSLGRDWRRSPGRPHARWTDQLRNDTGSVPSNLWRQAILRVHEERRDGPSWLRDDDDNDDDIVKSSKTAVRQTKWCIFSRCLNVSSDCEMHQRQL